MVKKFVFWGIIAVLLSAFAINANAQNKSEIIGTVLDSLNTPMQGATVMLMHPADDKLESFGLVGAKGQFRVTSESYGTFKLQITFVGYGTFAREVVVNNPNVDMGEIVLRTDAVLLEGVTVTDSFIPIKIKKDTVEYNANAFKTKPNATVEDLLKKLPGVEVDKEGNVTAQGEEVKKVLVDGKQFFEDDPKVATKNIPADVVDKVQVFDKKSDFSEFSGIDDGKQEKAINLEIKDGMNKGVFGNVKAGYGYEDFYEAGANLNRFTDKMQMTVLANTNNINERAFSIRDYLNFSGGLEDLMSGGNFDFSAVPRNLRENSGITDAVSAGLNFNFDFNEKTKFRSNYFFNKSDNITNINSSIQNNILGFNTDSDSDESSDFNNHRFRTKLTHQFDANQDIKIDLNLALTDSDSNEDSNSKTVVPVDILKNSSITDNRTLSDILNWTGQLSYRKKFKKKGRFLTTDLGYNDTNNSELRYLQNTLESYPSIDLTNIEIQDQLQDKNTYQDNYAVSVNYVEPVGEAKYLNFKVSRAGYTNERNKEFSDFNASDDIYVKDEILSNQFKSDYGQNTGGLAFKDIRKKFSYTVGLDYQYIDLKNKDLDTNESIDKTYNGLLPNADFKYELNKSASIELKYNTELSIPSIDRLQPVLDNSNRQNIYIGNPDLDREYLHQFRVNFRNFNQFYLRSLFFGITSQFKEDNIIESRVTDEKFTTTTTPVNLGNAWTNSAYYNFKTPFQNANLQISLRGNLSVNNSDLSVNSEIDQSTFTVYSQTIQLENKKKELIDVLAGFKMNSNFNNYKENSDQNQSYFTYNYYSDLVWYLSDTWTWDVSYEHQRYSAEQFGEETQINFLNSSITKTFLDNQISVYVKGMNLLDESLNISRTSFANTNSETIRNRIGRYVMLGARYKIRSFGK